MISTSNPRLLGAVAVAGGASWIATAAILTADRDGVRADEITTTAAHVAIGAMSLALVLTVAGVLLLSRSIPTSRAPWVVVVGQLLLAGASTVSNVRGEDAAWFVVAAPIANALWLFGSIATAAALRRAGVGRPVAIGLPLVWVGAIPLSVAGCAALSGAYWIAVGLGAVLAVRPRPAATAPVV